MATKVLHTVQVTITKSIADGSVSASCQAIATLPEIDGTRFGVNLPLDGDGVTALINDAVEALKVKMSEGNHVVEEAQPPAEEG
jgi:hypothetical protein|tara:strand:- start:47 stop:298 length:252 start_codon:yes stop_codon:yes gene_type:complete